MEILETKLDNHPDCVDLLKDTPFEPPSKHLETNLDAHPDCVDLLKDLRSSRLLRVPNFVSQAVADIVTAPLHRVKYARGLLVYLNVFWSTGTCYRLRGCCACISATAPRLADSFRTRRSRQRPRPRQRLHGTTTTTKGLIVYTKQTSRVGFNTYT